MEREHSLDNDGPERKRRRKVLSCTDCRRRKVQCDRALPACGRCTKAGKASVCIYEEDPPPALSGSNGSMSGSVALLSNDGTRPVQLPVTISRDAWDDMLSRLLHQERTIERLRDGMPTSQPDVAALVATANHSKSIPPGNTQGFKESMQFRGKSFKTQFHGPTDPLSSMSHVPEAFAYAREVISKSPALVRARRGLGELRQLKKSIDRTDRKDAVKDLLSYLPDQDRADIMTNWYLDNVDTVYGLIHVPSFREQYEAFSRNMQAGDPFFIATVLLMIASVECLMAGEQPLYVADSPLPRERACRAVEACEAWLGEQSHKHTSLAYFQIQCLLLVAKEGNGIKAKRRWIESGTLLRLAVGAGFHRDTEHLRKPVSAFEKEMRKRLWSFLVEQDLKASLNRGMPDTSLQIYSDCGQPSNLHDEEYDISATKLPQSHPERELTKMSYLRLSKQSQSLRSRLTTALNRPDHGLKDEDVLAFTKLIEEQLSLLPAWAGNKSGIVSSNEQTVILLHLQLEQFLLIMHASAAQRANATTSSRSVSSSFSRAAFTAVSRSMLAKLTALSAAGRHFLLVHRQDIVRIYVSASQLDIIPRCLANAAREPTGHSMTIRSLADYEMEHRVRSLLEISGLALDLLEARIRRSGNVQYTFTFALHDLLRNQLPAGTLRKDEEGSGCDRIYRLFRDITENQEPGFASKAAAAATTVTAPGESRSQGQAHVDTIDFENIRGESGIGGAGVQFQPGMGGAVSGDEFSFNDGTDSMGGMLDWSFDEWMLYSDPLWPANFNGMATSIT